MNTKLQRRLRLERRRPTIDKTIEYSTSAEARVNAGIPTVAVGKMQFGMVFLHLKKPFAIVLDMWPNIHSLHLGCQLRVSRGGYMVALANYLVHNQPLANLTFIPE